MKNLAIPFILGLMLMPVTSGATDNTTGREVNFLGDILKGSHNQYKHMRLGQSSSPRSHQFRAYDYGLSRCYTNRGVHLSNDQAKDTMCNSASQGVIGKNMINWNAKHSPAEFDRNLGARVVVDRLNYKNRLKSAFEENYNTYTHHESVIPAKLSPVADRTQKTQGRQVDRVDAYSLQGDINPYLKAYRLRNINAWRR